jgi:hypothetical protein
MRGPSSRDDAIQAQCRRMLSKMKAIDCANQRGLQITAAKPDSPQRALPKRICIPDAEFAVTGFDGKELFFKQRASSIGRINGDHDTKRELTDKRTAMVVPHPPVIADVDSKPVHIFPPKPQQTPLRRSLIARRWPSTAFIGGFKIGGKSVILRIEEHQPQRAFHVEAYAATTGQVSSVQFQVAFLPYANVDSYYRHANPHDEASVENKQHCAERILPCLVWTVLETSAWQGSGEDESADLLVLLL